jgi:hypothetical protein
MILHCKAFNIDGNSIIMGHDRETGKRYFIQSVNSEREIQDLPAYLYDKIESYEQILSIFWIENSRL